MMNIFNHDNPEAIDNWLLSSAKDAKQWRRVCWILCFSLCMLVAALIFQSRKPPIVYVAEVSDSGQVRTVGKAEHEYNPQFEVIKYFLSSFVKNIRAIPTDAVVLKENYLSAYNFVTVKGKTILNSYAREYDPFKKYNQNIAVSINVSSVIVRSESTYQITWSEERYENGIKTKTERYTGLFTTVIQKPSTEEMVRVNPLGIYIDFFNLSKEIQ
jgi:type IV secretion system protein TrbF